MKSKLIIQELNQKLKAIIRLFLCFLFLIENSKLLSQKQIDYHEVINICNKEINKVGASDSKANLYYKTRADAYYFLNNYNDAIKDYKTSILLGNKSSEVLSNLGICFFDIKKIDSSIKYLNKSLSIDENNLHASLYLSECFKATKKYNLAIKQLKGVEKKHPTNYQIKYNLGLLEMEIKEYDNAINKFNVCYQNNYLTINSLLNICNCLTQQNKLIKAQECIDKIKKIDSTNNFIPIYEGHILVKYNKIEDACSKYMQALKSGNTAATEYVDKHKCK